MKSSELKEYSDQIAKDNWDAYLHKESKKIHEWMNIACIVIFPIFAFFDQYTVPADQYWHLTSIRIFITISVFIWLIIQKVTASNHFNLSYYSFTAVSWFCAYASVLGGANNLLQHNIAYCTVFLAASLFVLWNWKYSLSISLSSIVVYALFIINFSDFTFGQVLLDGGAVLLTLIVLHPIIVMYRYNAFRTEYFLREALVLSNKNISVQNENLAQLNKQFIKAEDELKSVNTHLEDIVKERTDTLQKTNTELKTTVEELDVFLYSSYHDLKGPVTRLKGINNLAKKEVKDPVGLTYFGLMDKTIREMEFLMNKLNNLNMIRHHHPQKDFIDIPIIVSRLKKQLLIDDAEVIINVEQHNTVPFVNDNFIITTLLYQLIDNALKFKSPDRPCEIEIKLIQDDEEWLLRVKDNGIGIHKDYKDKIFSMFYRGVDNTAGHGLGLYLVKKGLEKVNGSIFVHSKVGSFTEMNMRFIFSNPIL